MPAHQVATETAAEAYFALLRARGIERLFVNGGTDFAPVAEAYARAAKVGLEFPTPIVVPHENVAVGMAHGAYLVTGEPQAVMLHVSVGTANAVMGIINAARDRVPILLTAGRTPLYERGKLGARSASIHWAQEMFDQAGMLREMVKWDYELRDGAQIEAIVDRAMSVAMSEPRGPIYLTLPREVLAETVTDFHFSTTPAAVATDPAASPLAMTELADLLARAKFPVIVTSTAAASRGAFAALDVLARSYAIGVVESAPRVVNLANDHPLHLGYEASTVFEAADVLCFVECDVPWFQSAGDPPVETAIVQCGVDPLFVRYPVRTHRADLAIMGSSKQIFDALLPLLEERRNKIDPARLDRIVAESAERRQRRRTALETAAHARPGITKAFMNWALGQVRPKDAVIVDEYWARAEVTESTQEGTEFHISSAGGLGWGLPAALGVQLESPGRMVIATLGDGAYMFSNAPACHHVMATNQLPVLTIICNNGRWGAVVDSALAMYPQGQTAEVGSSPLATLDQSHAFERYAEATGGYGERVVTQDGLVPALQRAMDVVTTEKRHAVLNVLSED
jgi:acetolactate synthase I/II/III large subunit